MAQLVGYAKFIGKVEAENSIGKTALQLQELLLQA